MEYYTVRKLTSGDGYLCHGFDEAKAMANHIHSLSGEQCAVFELIEHRVYVSGEPNHAREGGEGGRAMSDPVHDLSKAHKQRDELTRWIAERENATARCELARMKERLWLVLSQHEPVNSLGLNREALRKVLEHILNGTSINPEARGGRP